MAKSNAQDENAIVYTLAREFKAIKIPSLSTLALYRHMPTVSLLKPFKVAGYTIQPLEWGDQFKVVAIDYTKKATKKQGEVYQQMNEILTFKKTKFGTWENVESRLSTADTASVVKKMYQVLVSSPLGIMVSTGLVSEDLALPILSDATQLATGEAIEKCKEFAELYLSYCEKYPQFGTIKPNKLFDHLEHKDIKVLSGAVQDHTF